LKKVLIVTYYWPPSGGPGVQRWVKFVKYLKLKGWEPIVYTPENPSYNFKDNSLIKDIPDDITVIKQKIWEPYKIFKKLLFFKKGDKIKYEGFISSQGGSSSFLFKLSFFIRSNLFIPDSRKYWIKPSVKFLKTYIEKNNIPLVVTTGPPHSMHIIGMKLKQSLKSIKWIADFRDPWTSIYYFNDLKLSKFAKKIHIKLESKVLNKCDKAIVVTKSMNESLKSKGINKGVTITNGYDEEDIKNHKSTNRDKTFSVVHTGNINVLENNDALWRAFSEALNENKNLKNHLKIKLAGKLDASVINSINKYKLNDYVEILGYLPHKKIIELQSKAQLLLLILSQVSSTKYILTGKIFEYLAAKRPIFAIAPYNGEVDKIIKENKAGEVADFNETGKFKQIITSYFNDFLNDEIKNIDNQVEKYSRSSLTSELIECFETELKS